MKKNLILAVAMICGLALTAPAQERPVVQTPVYFDISPPLRDMARTLPATSGTSWKDGIVKNQFNIRERPDSPVPGGENDPSLQTADGPGEFDVMMANFDGNNNTEGYTPPDTHGDVGPNHYFQAVNCHYSIYSKSGTLLLGPLANSTVFNGLPNNSNDGDAIVLYDEQADRWLFSQFSLPNFPAGPFYQMIAVSATGDPTGSWYRYQYSFTNMPDYPKFGVWGDGYYMAINQFAASTLNWAGCGAVAFNRALMLAGSPAPTMVMFTKSSSDESFGMLPSDCDGEFPTGNPPNYFLYMYDGSSNDHLGLYQFHVDWTNTANSTFANYLSLPVTAFTANITGITQQGSSVKLDVINDRLMYRLQYRKFGDHESMVCNHTVDISSSIAGVRWYELRKTTGAWSIFQQGTYSLADNLNRWMGSIAMDASGNMALGYSVAGSTLYPSIRYTGRKASDALHQMTIAESTIITGGGAQTEATYHRWGDYSAMSCDPVDPATFWYTTEYYTTTSSTAWKTRIASFKFLSLPLVTTAAATAVTGSTATINGTVNPNGLSTNWYFEWGTTTGYGNTTPVTAAGSGTGDIIVSADLSGLITGTPYHYRLAATNSDGVASGNDMTFVPGLPLVTTTAATAIGSTYATAGGNVTADGGQGITARGVCWSVNPNPTIAGSHTTDGSGTGSFASFITGLSANTMFHIRAYATNPAGTSYGEDLTFTTLCTLVNTFPWTEGFESAGQIPSCWTQEQVNSSGLNWVFITGNGGSNPAAAHSGTYNACLKDNTTTDHVTRLVSPPIDLAGVLSPSLTFWHTQASWSGRQDQLYVYYRTSPTGAWTQLASYTSSVTAWTQRTLSLPNGSSTYYICFEGHAKYGRGVCVDDVQITCTPSTVGLTIDASANPVDEGTPVTFSATPVNGGTIPAYQWKVNGINATGGTNETYTYVPQNGDLVLCVLTSNASCVNGNPATSNAITMIVNPAVPAHADLQGMTLTGTDCFDAVQTITTAGGGTFFTVQTTGHATLIAGENILLYPGTTVVEGGYFMGYIAPGGPWCSSTDQPLNGSGIAGLVTPGPQSMTLFPNPTDGEFNVELPATGLNHPWTIRVFDLQGREIPALRKAGESRIVISLRDQLPGIYLLQATDGSRSLTARVVRIKR